MSNRERKGTVWRNDRARLGRARLKERASVLPKRLQGSVAHGREELHAVLTSVAGYSPWCPSDMFIILPDKHCGVPPLTNSAWYSLITHDVRKVHSGRTYNDAMRDSQRRGKTSQQLQPFSCTAHMPQHLAPAGLQCNSQRKALEVSQCSKAHQRSSKDTGMRLASYRAVAPDASELPLS